MSDQSDSSRGRVKRRPVSRAAPIRNWSTLFGPLPSTSGPEDLPPTEPGEDDPAPASKSSTVAEGVQLGYKVVEQHLKQAEHFARILYAPFSDKTESTPSLEGMTDRMFRHANDLASAWMEIVRSLDGAGTKRRTDAGAGPFGVTPTTTDATAPAAVGGGVSIEVESHRPFQTTVDLRPGAYAKNLLAHDLRTSDGEGPRLEGVRVSTDPVQGTVRISLTIPATLPAHTYSGVIVDAETDLPLGMLAVRVGEKRS